MIRRSLVGGTIGLLAVGLMFGKEAVNYAKTGAGCIRTSIDEAVPVEFKIEQAREMITEMEPEIRRNRHLIAREEVALENLEEQVNKLEQKQLNEKTNLLRMQAAVDRGEASIVFAGIEYTSDQVKRDMGNRFERYKTNDETLFNLRRALTARQKAFAAARLEMEEMLAARGQLVAEVEKLEARQKMVSVAQTSSEFDLDSSTLARAKNLIQEVENRLDVTERMLDVDLQYAEEIQLDGPTQDDISAQVADYFGSGSPEVESIAAEIELDPQL